MEENLRQEEAVEEGAEPEPFQEPNDMQMESPDDGQDSEAKKFWNPVLGPSAVKSPYP